MDCVGRRKARKFNTLQIATKKKKGGNIQQRSTNIQKSIAILIAIV